MTTARRAAGVATGALSGYFPDPAIGVPPLAGLALWDEFFHPPQGTIFGDLRWSLNTSGTGAGAQQATSTSTVIGVVRLSTAVGNDGDRAILSMGGPTSPLSTVPPIGSIWCVKVRIAAGVQDFVAWAGFASTPLACPYSAISNDFIGIRADGSAGVPNWFGVVRQGTSEAIVNLEVTANSEWVILGFRRLADGSIQFVSVDASIPHILPIEDVGTPLASPFPASNVFPVSAAIMTRNSTAKAIDIDFWGLGGRIARL